MSAVHESVVFVDCRGRCYRVRPGPRPRVPDTIASVRLSIRLTPTERHDLEIVARENHVGLMDVVREAVNEYVADYRETLVFRRPGWRSSSSS